MRTVAQKGKAVMTARIIGEPSPIIFPTPGKWSGNTPPDLDTWERALARTGQLVSPEVLADRSAACSTCARRRPSSRPDVWGCSACGSCAGKPERMLATSTTCPLNLWSPLSPAPSVSTPPTSLAEPR